MSTQPNRSTSINKGKRAITYAGNSSKSQVQVGPSSSTRSNSNSSRIRTDSMNSNSPNHSPQMQPTPPGSPSPSIRTKKNTRYKRNDNSKLQDRRMFKPLKLKSRSESFVSRAMPVLKVADHHEHTEDDLKQAAMELWSRHHRTKDKLENLLLNPEALSVEIANILPPSIKHRGCLDQIIIARHKLNVKLHQTYLGLGWEFVIMMLSLVTILNYVLETYAESSSYSPFTEKLIITTDIICNSVFALDFLMQTMTSHPFYGHILTGDGMIDFVTVVPFLMNLSIYGIKFPTFNCRPENIDLSTLVNDCAPSYAPNVDAWGLITFLRFTRILKNIRLLREARLIKIFRMIFHVDMATSRLVALSIGVLGTFTLATSIIYLVENELENYFLAYHTTWGMREPEAEWECYSHGASAASSCGMSWINSFYMIVVTFTTVGYGDFSPKSDPSQIVMIAILLVGVAWLSGQIGRANAIMAEVPRHKIPYRVNSSTGHICVLGGFARQTLLSFLEEHFHPDHRTPGSKLEAENVVIMQPHAAPAWLRHLIVHHDHASQLHYYHGSIYSTLDLRAIHLHKAQHCFIFANVHSQNFVKDDANAVVHATALKSWTEAIDKPPPLHIQVHLESTRRRLAKLSRNGGTQDVCVDIDGLKARIFGHNFMCPGASTFLENLFTSFAGPAGVENHEHHSVEGELEDDEAEWLAEYYHGCGQELYTTKAPQCLSGTLFADTVIAVYLGHVKTSDDDASRTPDGVIVVGVVENPHLTTSGRKVLINPNGNYRIKPHSHLMVIADDESKARALAYAHNMPKFCKAGGMVLYALSQRRRSKSSLKLKQNIEALADDAQVEMSKMKNVPRASITENMEHIHKDTNGVVHHNLQDVKGAMSPAAQLARKRAESQGRVMFSHEDAAEGEEEKEEHHVDHLIRRMDDMHNKISALLPHFHLTSTGGSLDMWRRLDGVNGGRLTEWPELDDHIIICGDLRRLPEFVCSIREGVPCHLGDHEAIVEVPIVCLSPLDDMTANKLWGLTSGVHDPEVMHEVYQARGDPSNDNDLRSVSLETASSVLILGNAITEDSSDDNERNIESSILTAYFAIQTELAFMPHKHVRVAVETQWSMAMSMLDNMRQMFHFHKKTQKQKDKEKHQKHHHMGDQEHEHHNHPLHEGDSDNEESDEDENEAEAIPQGCCKRMFDKHGLHRKLKKKNAHQRYSFMAGPLYAAGGAISARFFDTFLCQTMFTPEVLDFLFACVSFREDHDEKGIGDRALLQLEIMDHLVGKQFQQLFSFMLKKYGLLVVALYRSHKTKLQRNDGLPYVQTSPRPDTVIRRTDRVFVLATFPLLEATAYMCDQYSSAREMFSSASSYKHGRAEAVTHVERVQRKQSLYAMAKRASLGAKPNIMSLIRAASSNAIGEQSDEVREGEEATKEVQTKKDRKVNL